MHEYKFCQPVQQKLFVLGADVLKKKKKKHSFGLWLTLQLCKKKTNKTQCQYCCLPQNGYKKSNGHRNTKKNQNVNGMFDGLTAPGAAVSWPRALPLDLARARPVIFLSFLRSC